jgi:RNA polymerase subunit RPABC4/transcription elongation factor Spt4
MQNYEPQATIASIVPFRIDARKIGIHPGDFFIPESDGKNFVILVVKTSKYHVYMGCESAQKFLNIDATPYEVARAIVQDFARSVIGITGDGGPGIFWVPDALSVDQIHAKHPEEIDDARKRQILWFKELVRMADDDWVKSNHKHSAVSNLQRFAVKFLNYKREYLEAVEAHPELLNIIPCPICTTMINKAAIKCSNCGSVVKAKEWADFNAAIERENALYANAGKSASVPRETLSEMLGG